MVRSEEVVRSGPIGLKGDDWRRGRPVRGRTWFRVAGPRGAGGSGRMERGTVRRLAARLGLTEPGVVRYGRPPARRGLRCGRAASPRAARLRWSPGSGVFPRRGGRAGGGVRPCREPVPSSAAVGEPARRAALPVPYCAPAPAGRPRSRERYSRPGKRVQPRGAGLPRALPAARPGLRRRAGRGCSRRVDWRAPVALPERQRQRQPRRASPPCNAGLPSVSFGPGRCEKSHRPCG